MCLYGQTLIGLWRTSWPWSRTQSLEHCFLASMRTLNIVHTDKGTRKSVDLLDFCILESKAALVLDIRDGEISYMKSPIFKLNASISPQIADLLTQASIISLAISLSLCSRCLANSGSGQCRSITNIWRASSFQNRSSDVAEPLLRKTETVTC